MGLASKPTSSMEQPLLTPVIRVLRSIWRGSGTTEGERAIPEETAIAFTYNTASYAVMMATPQDLEDFAVGFSLTEGVISSLDAIESIDIVEEAMGVELRIWLKSPEAAEFLGPPPEAGRSHRLRALRGGEPDRGDAAATQGR